MKSVRVSHFGPVKEGQVEFGDLTLLVGPQATGKSLFLQLFKLLVDIGAVKAELQRFNLRWNRNIPSFLELYFGEGMSGLYDQDNTQIVVDGQRVDLPQYVVRSRQ